MTDAIPLCSRCRKPLDDNAFALLLEKELPGSVPQDLQLCPQCVESFHHWYLKREQSSIKAVPNLLVEDSSASSATTGSNRSKRRRRLKNKKTHPLIRILVVASLAILLFIVAFYWTWTILRTATRNEE
jgi:hypothetical protein